MADPFCPKCPHCAKSPAEASAPATLQEARLRMRCWDYPGYGQKITGIVDFYDGWDIGCRAESEDEAVCPPKIIDRQRWFEGFMEAWKDSADVRAYRAERKALVDA